MPQKRNVQSTFDKNGDSSSTNLGQRRSERLQVQEHAKAVSSHHGSAHTSNVPHAVVASAGKYHAGKTPGHGTTVGTKGEHSVGGAVAGGGRGSDASKRRAQAGWG